MIAGEVGNTLTAQTRFFPDFPPEAAMSYAERAAKHPSAAAKSLLQTIDRKKSNLCVSLDVTSTSQLLSIADQVGPYVCMVKTHIDIVDDFDYKTTVGGLLDLAKKHDFLIFEDRKFADIGSTVKAQFGNGVFQIANWADIVNAHAVPGPGIISGLERASVSSNRPGHGLLLLAELSSQGSLATGDYTEATIAMARQSPDFVIGFIAQHPIADPEHDWLVLTPGVGLDDKGDGLGQQYRTVDDVVGNGSDVIIVGRGIYKDGRDIIREAERYRNSGWEAYTRRLASRQ